MSYPVVEVRYEDRETEDGPVTVTVPYPVQVVEIENPGAGWFNDWRVRHPNAEIVETHYAAVYDGTEALTVLLVIYREPDEAGEEGER